MKIVFATQNENKLKEVQSMMPEGVELISLTTLGQEEELEETSSTLEGNAEQKAVFVYEKFGMSCFADDTGLEIDALDGAPGVYSARYAGEAKSAEANMDKVLQELSGSTNRQAQFRTSICLVSEGQKQFFDGIVKGRILSSRQGEKGFGYDPIFAPEGEERSFAEMSQDEKNAISHRGRAIRALKEFLSQK
ncbi:MAG: non-canonical purine NTP diphosphatase [Flavobacteriia bacterium]|nr:non-canonical purine NTP diphosphatase [Flavobacteriia bacterium]